MTTGDHCPKNPGYAVVLAGDDLVGPLFLPLGQDRTTGWLQVAVQGPDFVHTALSVGSSMPASHRVVRSAS